MSPYNTHLPILKYALERFNEAVLEVGAGEFSTPEIISRSKFSVTLENNREWYEKCRHLEKHHHYIHFSENLLKSVEFVCDERDLDLVFVDSNNWKERCEIVNLLSKYDSIKVVILHDSFPEHIERCINYFGSNFKYAYSMNFYPVSPDSIHYNRPEYPPTLVLSNIVSFADWSIKHD